VDSVALSPTVVGLLWTIGGTATASIVIVLKFKTIFDAFAETWAKSEKGKAVLVQVIIDELNNPESVLGYHRNDENAHERMRQKILGSFNERLDNLETTIITAQAMQHEELNKFRTEMTGQFLTVTERLLDILENQTGGKSNGK
jgi:hypothetical protein